MLADDFTILTVCTGNICRSPLAEQLLRAGLERLPIGLSSAGTIAVPGATMPEPARLLSLKLGGDPSSHSAARLAKPGIEGAGLVLVMAREHRSAVVRMVPRANRTTFTIREFARLVKGADDRDLRRIVREQVSLQDRIRAAVKLVNAQRGYVIPPNSPNDDDVVDPFQRADSVYISAGDQISQAVEVVVSFLQKAASAEEL